MWQRHLQRTARQALSALKTAGSAAAAGRLAAASAKQAASSHGPALSQSAAFQSFSKAMGGSRSMLGFAASAAAPAHTGPAATCGAHTAGLNTSSASGAVSSEGSDDESSPTNTGGASAASASEDSDGNGKLKRRKKKRCSALWAGQGAGRAGGSRAGGGGGGSFRAPPDSATETLVLLKDSFLQKPMAAMPIPLAVREVMYQHRWDKLLVDVRRSVAYAKGQGKQEEYTAMVAVGNMKGLFGLGLGDAPTAQQAVAAAYLDAFNKITTIPLYRSHTIYNHIEHKYNSLKFLLSPRADGTGIVANDLLVELCNLAGIRNISIKVYGRRRPKFFVAAGFLEALQHQTVPHDGVEGSGVYVREVQRPSHHTPPAAAAA